MEKKYYTVQTSSIQQQNLVNDFLENPLHGANTALSGCCHIHDKHISVNGFIQLYLDINQVNELYKKFDNIVIKEHIEPVLDDGYTLVDLASGKYVPFMWGGGAFETERVGPNLLSHNVYHTQKLNVDRRTFNEDSAYNTVDSLSTIDCSNVDILLLDTGVDRTHPELSGLVVDFDWTLLGEGEDGSWQSTGSQIITGVGMPGVSGVHPDYYDLNVGHGTGVASLIAGKRSGVARGAKIYSIRFLDGSNKGLEQYVPNASVLAMKLAYAFIKAKNNNLLGLDSSRPTVLCNSWSAKSTNYSLPNSLVMSGNSSLDYGCVQSYYHRGEGESELANSHEHENELFNIYTSLIVLSGGHFLTSAGNNNMPLFLHPMIVDEDFLSPAILRFDSLNNSYRFCNLTKEMLPLSSSIVSSLSTFEAAGPISWDSANNLSSAKVVILSGDSDTISTANNKISNPVTVKNYYSEGDVNIYNYSSHYTTPYIHSTIKQGLETLEPAGFNYIEEDSQEVGYTVNILEMNGIHREVWPEIVSIAVGDVTPVINPFERLDIYEEAIPGFIKNTRFISLQNANDYYYPVHTSVQAGYAVNTLSCIDSDEFGIFRIGVDTLYDSISSASYIKTSYSNWGPLVDIYAPGNGSIAAYPMMMETNNSSYNKWCPRVLSSNDEFNGGKYWLFNGTSAATPVAAGCLATYLAVHPTATPREAKKWLIDASIKGSILETNGDVITDADGYDRDNYFGSVYTLSGKKYQNITSYTGFPKKYIKDNFNIFRSAHYCTRSVNENSRIFTANATQYGNYPITELPDGFHKRLIFAHNHPFYKSHNRVVQAYPPRQVIVSFQEGEQPQSARLLSSNMVLSGETTKKTTHGYGPDIQY
jgi:hypothetical protein